MTGPMDSNRLVHAMALLAALVAFAAQEIAYAAEASATYTYDEIGRLRDATTVGNDTRTVTYTYDAAGNRTNVSAGVSPTVPASITVPASSMTGSYSVGWGASTGTVTAYQLFEATNASFAGETSVYSGTSTSTSISGRGNGAYYYRVRACNGTFCSAYRTGGNPTSVTLPPSTPASITVPATSTTGSYSISWSAVSAPVTAYELYEATNSSFTGQTQVYSGTATSQALSGRGNGTYYYRVRACNGAACSGYREGGNGNVVTLPPGIPASISVPSSSNTGAYTVSWGTSTGNVTAYELYEATNSGFTGQALIYSNTGTSIGLSGRGNGTYYYRVRACNGTACGDYRPGTNPTTVTLPPSMPASISVPATSTTGSYSISWSAVSAPVTAYELYEATNSSFTGQTQVYSGTATSQALSGRGNGGYYYRVRACNGSACSGYREGGNGIVVTLPPGIPASISVPSSSNTGAYTVSWGTSTGSVTAYELYEATNSGFTGQTLVYSNTGTSIGLSGRGNGTYYYRVRACNGTSCSGYRTGANATTVTLPPGVPASISVPASSITGSYTVGWGVASGTLTAYELYEATNSGFSGQSLVYSGTSTSTSISGRGNGTYYYRVRACNAGQCSGYRTGGNSTVVTIPPGIPASISVPSYGTTVSYTVSWGTSSGTVTAYELYEATNASFSGETVAYSGTGTSTALTGRSSGTYYYRVRACNTSAACGGHRIGSNGVIVTPPIAVLNPSISVFHTGAVTNIGTLANLNGNPATIHSFSLSSCSLANVTIQGGAQSVSWVNDNYYYYMCEFGFDIQCSANYVIRNSNSAQLYPGTASVTIVAQPIDLPPGQSCN